MEYILEFFDFLKKQDTWQNKFDNIYKIYQKNKTNYDLELLKRPHAMTNGVLFSTYPTGRTIKKSVIILTNQMSIR